MKEEVENEGNIRQLTIFEDKETKISSAWMEFEEEMKHNSQEKERLVIITWRKVLWLFCPNLTDSSTILLIFGEITSDRLGNEAEQDLDNEL